MRRYNPFRIIVNLICTLPVIFVFSCRSGRVSSTQNIDRLEKYNVIWESPSTDHHGSMPVGNGDIGLNVWVEKNGDICFYIGKTDSWGDNGRLLKVGKVRVTCDPAIVLQGSDFKQELDLYSGTIRITSHRNIEGKRTDFSLCLWVDANHPVIHLIQESSIPVKLIATIELWRTEPDTLPELGVSDLLEDRSKPGSLHEPVIVEPDFFIHTAKDRIGWFHHNAKSVGFELTNRLQGLSGFFTSDPILHRTFGALITGSEARHVSDNILQTAPSKTGRLNVYVLTRHPSEPAEWQGAIETLASEIEEIPFIQRYTAHEGWWAEFWNRSWIHATSVDSGSMTSENNAFNVSRAYALQRFINASAGRGDYPIKFNGSIFTVPEEEPPGILDLMEHISLNACISGVPSLHQPMAGPHTKSVLTSCRRVAGISGNGLPAPNWSL